LTSAGERFDIQLKGSGRTPYSRSGDGRAALGPMLREYLIAEAMYSLGIPTTRSLAVVTTGEMVRREKPLPGAVLTRLASSHIRVGTFEYAAQQEGEDLIPSILNYTIKRHYPELQGKNNQAVSFLEAVMEKQADLVVNWLRVGFIHGVMNTDNMTLSGESIDYGPCAFMDSFHPGTVFSSIDREGRYAYANQPAIAQWNLARLAETLLPLIDQDIDRAVEIAKETINRFSAIYQKKWIEMMRAKIGLFGEQSGDIELISDLLKWMEDNNADFTNTFLDLSQTEKPEGSPYDLKAFSEWYDRWQARLKEESKSFESALDLMKSTNPVVIPRNHKVEEALRAAVGGEFTPFKKLVAVLKDPYQINEKNIVYREPPKPGSRVYQTFCGT